MGPKEAPTIKKTFTRFPANPVTASRILITAPASAVTLRGSLGTTVEPAMLDEIEQKWQTVCSWRRVGLSRRSE